MDRTIERRQRIQRYEVAIHLPAEINGQSIWFKLLGFLRTPCCHLSLLPVLRQSRRRLASGDLCCSSFFWVWPDVYLRWPVCHCSGILVESTRKKPSVPVEKKKLPPAPFIASQHAALRVRPAPYRSQATVAAIYPITATAVSAQVDFPTSSSLPRYLFPRLTFGE